MCSIFRLHQKYTLPYDMLFNAVHNNEHGYGILLKDGNKIQVIKDMPAKVDPEKIYKILKDNEDIERWVHLRNSSQGEVHMDNVQPIQVYHSSKRDVFFMHNGTIYNVYVSDNQKSFLAETLDEKVHSDSKKFAVGKIAPLLIRMKGEHGVADIHDPFFQEIMQKNWPTTNGRGVLISSDQEPLLFNSSGWEKIKDKFDDEFLASNDEYFKAIIRGTLFREREKAAEAKKPKREIVPVKQFDNKEIFPLRYPPFEKMLSFSEEIVNILEEYDLYSPEGFIAMGNIDVGELEKLFKDHPYDGAAMFLYLTSYLKEATIANEKLLQKIEKPKPEVEYAPVG